MALTRAVLAVLAGVAAALPSAAADFSDPTWPCIQRKVGALSPGLMWSLPYDAETGAGTDEVGELADTLSLRRVALAGMRPEVEDFAARHNGDPQRLGAVFARAFATLSGRRDRIIAGIGKFSLGQIALAAKIDENRAEMDRLLAAEAPDHDRIDAIEEQIAWDETIYTDRQRSITYLCETPVLLERRLFEIAQMLQAVADDG